MYFAKCWKVGAEPNPRYPSCGSISSQSTRKMFCVSQHVTKWNGCSRILAQGICCINYGEWIRLFEWSWFSESSNGRICFTGFLLFHLWHKYLKLTFVVTKGISVFSSLVTFYQNRNTRFFCVCPLTHWGHTLTCIYPKSSQHFWYNNNKCFDKKLLLCCLPCMTGVGAEREIERRKETEGDGDWRWTQTCNTVTV